jgi:hypothetical protein
MCRMEALVAVQCVITAGLNTTCGFLNRSQKTNNCILDSSASKGLRLGTSSAPSGQSPDIHHAPRRHRVPPVRPHRQAVPDVRGAHAGDRVRGGIVRHAQDRP